MNGIRKLIVLILLTIPSTMSFAQTRVPMSNWKVADTSSRNPSKVTAADITLRVYSNVVWENVNLEMSSITMKVRSKARMHTGQNLSVSFHYDDGFVEVLKVEFPGTNTQVTTVTKSLRLNKGRQIKKLELGHGRSGGRYHITEISYNRAPPTAVFINQSKLGGAKLNQGDAMHNNVLVVKRALKNRPFLSNIPSTKMQLVASVTGFRGYSGFLVKNMKEYSLTIFAMDKQGNTLKTLRVPLTLEVKEVDIDLGDVDVKLVDRIVFSSGYSGIRFAVRQVNFGAGAPTSSSRCVGLRQINDRFSKQIEGWKNQGVIGNRYIKELEAILRELKRLE